MSMASCRHNLSFDPVQVPMTEFKKKEFIIQSWIKKKYICFNCGMRKLHDYTSWLASRWLSSAVLIFAVIPCPFFFWIKTHPAFFNPLRASHGLMGWLRTAYLPGISPTLAEVTACPIMANFWHCNTRYWYQFSSQYFMSYLRRMFQSQAPGFCFPVNYWESVTPDAEPPGGTTREDQRPLKSVWIQLSVLKPVANSTWAERSFRDSITR